MFSTVQKLFSVLKFKAVSSHP